MRVLIIKMSSLGDIVHTLPALSDAAAIFPEIEFDWVVEEPFQAIPAFHPRVKRVLPIALRRWRKNWRQPLKNGEYKNFLSQLRAESYDHIIDAQGLFKSVAIARLARGKSCGFAFQQAREPFASLFYHRRISTEQHLHAVSQTRALFAKSLGYTLPNSEANYGIDPALLPTQTIENYRTPYVVFLHGTTWPNKHWPEYHWVSLAKKAAENGISVRLLWGNETERQRAENISRAVSIAEVCPKLRLPEVASVLQGAKAVVTVDTGLGHLACALNVPTLALFGPTDPRHVGIRGLQSLNLNHPLPCSPCGKRTCRIAPNAEPPCLDQLSPTQVWKGLEGLLASVN